MSDQAPPIVITPGETLCYRCVGPRGDSLVVPGEEEQRHHLFHDDGSVNEDDRHHYERGGSRIPLGHAEEA